MPKTIAEINDKIARRKAVVLTAEEMIALVENDGPREAANQVDVVTTGTFGPMCSSGMLLNIGQPKVKIKLGGGNVALNDVPAYAGFAAADIYLGCTQISKHDPANTNHPGEFRYGGAHVIEDFAAGKDIRLSAEAYGTDCYPSKKLETWINIKDVNSAILYNPRNAYQNYNVAVNLSNRTLYTYMGILKPNLGNANYCSAGQLSPLLNDPMLRTIGIGTRIFLGGGVGYVIWQGTQHNPATPRAKNGIPLRPACTLAVMGDLKQMNPRWLVGSSMVGYGATLTVGIGVPIPILDEEMAVFTSVKDENLSAPIVDYNAYGGLGSAKSVDLGSVSYARLKTGSISIQGQSVPTASLSSYARALEIAETLKDWIGKGRFELTRFSAPLPGPDSGITMKPLTERPIRYSKKKPGRGIV